ncbi:hypothetical protein PoB_006013100 [Plakobranchus ocellatus]|uniref:Odorant receptor n=1 Tax=Plakobranchus ocellatus TaxID=259542 RepID=A0AAV4CP21_9GAST|nr:hypothetical protein PoB_006013100 [Plakobranchus ocellatus]
MFEKSDETKSIYRPQAKYKTDGQAKDLGRYWAQIVLDIMSMVILMLAVVGQSRELKAFDNILTPLLIDERLKACYGPLMDGLYLYINCSIRVSFLSDSREVVPNCFLTCVGDISALPPTFSRADSHVPFDYQGERTKDGNHCGDVHYCLPPHCSPPELALPSKTLQSENPTEFETHT